jgi:hypothetical protein
VFPENNPVLGSQVRDTRFEYVFHTAVRNTKLDVEEVIQDILYHTGVLISPYFVQLARFIRDDE